jgi:magnesium and cobalt exporter, CNNM family
MSDLAGIIVAVVLLALNAFFVGAEFALISARRTQIEPRAQAGSRVARLTLRAMENISLVMAGAQLGITICSLGLGAVGEPAVAQLLAPAFHTLGLPDALLHPVAFTVALTIVVYLHVVAGEMVPKNLTLAMPERAALLFGPPMVLFVTVLKPVVVSLNAVANGVLRLVRIPPTSELASAFTHDEVAAMVEESRGQGLLRADEYDRLAGTLEFTERTVTAVLIPPERLATLPRGATVAEVEATCARTGYSRFPVTNGRRATAGHADAQRDHETRWALERDAGREAGRDGGLDLVGYLHIIDVLATDPARQTMPVSDKWIRQFAHLRPTDRLHDALGTLQRRGAHLGLVVDDHGTTLGVATLEDIIEELVGEIRDAAHINHPGA